MLALSEGVSVLHVLQILLESVHMLLCMCLREIQSLFNWFSNEEGKELREEYLECEGRGEKCVRKKEMEITDRGDKNKRGVTNGERVKETRGNSWPDSLTSHSIISGPIFECKYGSHTSLVQLVLLDDSSGMSRFRPAHVEGGRAESGYDGRLHPLWDSPGCRCHHLNTNVRSYTEAQKQTGTNRRQHTKIYNKLGLYKKLYFKYLVGNTERH